MSTHLTDKRHVKAVASTRHTVVFLLAILVLAIVASRSPIAEWPRTLTSQHERLLLYVRIIAMQCLWVGYVWFGMRHSTTTLRTLIDESRWTTRRWLRYLALGVAGWFVYLAIGGALSSISNPSPEALRGLQAMLPHTTPERTLWVAFALTAGVCEEVVYRGYLLQQFRALTGSTLAALVLQTVCYSLTHLALPPQMLIGVVVLGLLLGGLAVWQKSLVPGMILHVGVGLVAMISPGE